MTFKWQYIKQEIWILQCAQWKLKYSIYLFFENYTFSEIIVTQVINHSVFKIAPKSGYAGSCASAAGIRSMKRNYIIIFIRKIWKLDIWSLSDVSEGMQIFFLQVYFIPGSNFPPLFFERGNSSIKSLSKQSYTFWILNKLDNWTV